MYRALTVAATRSDWLGEFRRRLGAGRPPHLLPHRPRPRPTRRFQHLGGFPAETGEGCVSPEEADGDGHAPVRGNHHSIERELADQAEEEAAAQVNEQGAVWECACRADLHYPLEAVTRQRAGGAKNRDQRKTQCRSRFKKEVSLAFSHIVGRPIQWLDPWLRAEIQSFYRVLPRGARA